MHYTEADSDASTEPRSWGNIQLCVCDFSSGKRQWMWSLCAVIRKSWIEHKKHTIMKWQYCEKAGRHRSRLYLYFYCHIQPYNIFWRISWIYKCCDYSCIILQQYYNSWPFSTQTFPFNLGEIFQCVKTTNKKYGQIWSTQSTRSTQTSKTITKTELFTHWEVSCIFQF